MIVSEPSPATDVAFAWLLIALVFTLGCSSNSRDFICAIILQLTQVQAVDRLIPRRSAHSAFVSMTTLRSSSRRSGRPNSPGLSQTPVIETPRSLSSLHVSFQIFLTYLKSVNEDCIVPRMAAILAFRFSVSSVSLTRTTISVRLQN